MMYASEYAHELESKLDEIFHLHRPIIEDGVEVGCIVCDWDQDSSWPCATRLLALTRNTE